MVVDEPVDAERVVAAAGDVVGNAVVVVVLLEAVDLARGVCDELRYADVHAIADEELAIANSYHPRASTTSICYLLASIVISVTS